jgi:DNA-binding MarR family transcriptional regulator
MSAAESSSRFTKEPFGPPLIGALLRIPWEAVQRHMRARLHEAGFDDLDTAHLNVLRYPGPQGERPTELATRLGMSKQALNYQLGELERLGYLERRPDPDDARGRRIAVTERGVAVVGVIRDAVADIEATWARQLGAERFDQLRGLLLELNELATPPTPGKSEAA